MIIFLILTIIYNLIKNADRDNLTPIHDLDQLNFDIADNLGEIMEQSLRLDQDNAEIEKINVSYDEETEHFVAKLTQDRDLKIINIEPKMMLSDDKLLR